MIIRAKVIVQNVIIKSCFLWGCQASVWELQYYHNNSLDMFRYRKIVKVLSTPVTGSGPPCDPFNVLHVQQLPRCHQWGSQWVLNAIEGQLPVLSLPGGYTNAETCCLSSGLIVIPGVMCGLMGWERITGKRRDRCVCVCERVQCLVRGVLKMLIHLSVTQTDK